MECHVYFISDGEYIKIGITKNVESRMRDLQVANARKLTLLSFIPMDGRDEAQYFEQQLHNHLYDFHVSGEFFNNGIE